jgi:polyphosphate:AMP phosphotransferase
MGTTSIAQPAPKLSKKEYEARLPLIREELVRLQIDLKDGGFPVLFIIAGTEGAGRGEVINKLSGWLDPRGIETIAFNERTDEERERPWIWRYWQTIPAAGRIGIYAESWYTEALAAHFDSRRSISHLERELEAIRRLESLLSEDGALVIKIWLHLSKSDQKKRLEELEQSEDTAWRVTPEHWKHHQHYARYQRTADYVIGRTSRSTTPWIRIEAENERGRDLAIAEILIKRFRQHTHRVERRHGQIKTPAETRPLRAAGRARLLRLPLDQGMSADEYDEKREKWLGKLHDAVQAAHLAKRSVVFAFEGWDAAGKGGAIRRLTSAIDARDFRVIPVAKPTDEERARHYLWRFWRRIPRDGLVTIFDRSWYGRVLVERLEGFARGDEWRRAYNEICTFEEELVRHGIVVIKFWLQISPEEQLKRFRAREDTPYKRHKMSDEDWRNRKKWKDYEIAVGDMLALTDTKAAPWHLVAANNKRFARLEVLKLACRQIESALGL